MSLTEPNDKSAVDRRWWVRLILIALPPIVAATILRFASAPADVAAIGGVATTLMILGWVLASAKLSLVVGMTRQTAVVIALTALALLLAGDAAALIAGARDHP